MHSFPSEYVWLPRWLSGEIIHLQCRRHGFNPWVGKIPGEGTGKPLQYSCLENPMDREAWWVTVHGVLKFRHHLVTEQQQQKEYVRLLEKILLV